MRGLDEAAEMNVVKHLRPRELPWVAERKPLLRIFLLPAVLDDLTKQSVVIADAVAGGGDPQARHALHEAGREPSEAAVAERRVGLGRPQAVEVHAQISERGAEHVFQAQIAQHVGPQPADQEFQREVIDPLAALGVAGALRGQPAMDDAVANRECGRQKPVAIGGRAGILPDREDQLGEHRALDFDQRLLARSRTALQQGVARHVSKLASRARIIHYRVLQGVAFRMDPVLPTAHSAGSLRGLAAWSRCKRYAGPPRHLPPHRRENQWVSLRFGSVSIGSIRRPHGIGMRLNARPMDRRCRRSTRCPRDPCRCSRVRHSPAFAARA